MRPARKHLFNLVQNLINFPADLLGGADPGRNHRRGLLQVRFAPEMAN